MSEELPLAKMDGGAIERPALTAMQLLQGAIEGGITAENVAVVKELRQMVKEERDDQAKVKFNKAFFALRRELGGMDFYADKAAKTDGGNVAYTYCSEKELESKLEPVLFKHGFTMLFGQRADAEKLVAIVTLIHEDGHEETREYSVRSGGTNRMKDATAADTGATTSAWRHLVIKMFGIKSRIREEDDARNMGETNVHVTPEQSEELKHRLTMINGNPVAFLALAGAKAFAEIPAAAYPIMDRFLKSKENPKGKV